MTIINTYSCGYYVAVQGNGGRLRYEAWVIERWRNGELTDPFLLRGLQNAVSIYKV